MPIALPLLPLPLQRVYWPALYSTWVTSYPPEENA